MLGCARHRRDPLGGVRRLRRARARGADRRRHAEAGGLGVLRHRGGPGDPVQAAARRARSRTATHKPERCIILQRPQARRELMPGRDLDWDEALAGGRAGRLRAGRGDRPALHPLHLGHHRPAQGHRARQRRPCRGAALDACRTSTTSHPGEVFWAASDVGWVVGHSYICYAPLLNGNTTVSTRASRSARPIPARSGG